MRAYLDALYKELAFVAKHHRDKKLTTIYIGGGTPTALDEECLSKLMNMIHELFPVEESEEFTVESGRPDSITKEKFRILKEAGVTRISINPQTMHQETLSQMVVTLIILFPSAPLCGKGSLFAGQPDTFPENAVQALPNLFLPPSTS